jgi:hypothetical protein
MYCELCYYSWILWCSSLSTLWWIESFPLRFCYVGLNLWMWEHLMYVLWWDIRGDDGMFYRSTWCMFWLSTCGYPWWHWGNLCIGVCTHFHIPFSDRNLGVLFEVLCVGLNIMNLELFDAYHIINPRILVVTLEYLGDIRVGWYVSYGVILVRTLGLFVTLIGIAQWIDREE